MRRHPAQGHQSATGATSKVGSSAVGAIGHALKKGAGLCLLLGAVAAHVVLLSDTAMWRSTFKSSEMEVWKRRGRVVYSPSAARLPRPSRITTGSPPAPIGTR